MLKLIREAEFLEYHQVSDRVSAQFNRLEGGIQCRLILQLFIGPTHNEILYLVHVGFIYIFLPQFLTDSLIDVLLFEVCHLYVSFGTLGASVRHDVWNLWVGEGRRCIGHDIWMKAIAVRCAQISFQFLHLPEKLVRGSRSNIEDLAF